MAACSEADRGSTVFVIRNMESVHGLTSSPSVPASICGHSVWTTVRA